MAEPDPVFDVRYPRTPQIGTIVERTHNPATLAMPHLARRALWAAFRADDSAWDAVVSHQFALADILYHVGACPVGWDFRHPSARNCLADMLACDHEADCGCQWPDGEYLPIADCPQALIYAGQVLARYRRRWFCDTCETRRSECSCD